MVLSGLVVCVFQCESVSVCVGTLFHSVMGSGWKDWQSSFFLTALKVALTSCGTR